jgi:pyruvate/2-oxoglutarate dehydrogenase complex dihydrolipoamide dehydrogenase (E3) component
MALQGHVGFCKLYADPATWTLLGAHIMDDQQARTSGEISA